MVFEDDGGGNPYGALGQPIYGTPDPVLVPPPTSGAIAGSGEVATTAAVASTIAELAAETGSVITLSGPAPSASKPLEGLPAHPQQGVLYQFASSPTILYVNGPDGIWRAAIAVPVA